MLLGAVAPHMGGCHQELLGLRVTSLPCVLLLAGTVDGVEKPEC